MTTLVASFSCSQLTKLMTSQEFYPILPIFLLTNNQYQSNTTCTSVFLISSYGTPLAQRVSYLALHSSLWASDAVNYDYIVTNIINCVNWLKLYSQWHTY